MTALVLVPVLAAAIGTDLGLALFVVGLLFTWNAAPTELAAMGGLATPWVLAVAAGVWIAETVVEQFSITTMALWHTAQVVARPVAVLLLSGAVVAGERPLLSLGVPVVAAAATVGVHAGAVGWLAFLHLGAVPTRTRWVASFAEDAAVIALLALGLDHPLPALALLVLLTVAAPRHHLTSLAGFQLLLRGVVGDARGLLAKGGWWSGDRLPRWVLRRLATRDGGGDPGAPEEWKGAPAALRGPGPSRLRYGWLAVGRGHRLFLPHTGGAVPLRSGPDAGAEEDRIVTRLHLSDGLTVYLPPDGPGEPELNVEFGGGG